MKKHLVIVHENFGIYVGNAMGMGFWSKMDAAGQVQVPTFPSIDEAREHVSGWDENNNPDDYRFEEMPHDNPYVTIEELEEAGLSDYIGDLYASREAARGLGFR